MTALPLLQVGWELRKASPTTIIVIGIVFAAVLIAIIVSAVSSNRRKQLEDQKARSGGYTKGTFKKRARMLGLSPEQVKSLENLIAKYQISKPMQLLSNSSALDITLRKAIKEISESSSSDQVKEAHILTLYRIKQTIERNSQPKKVVSTSKQIGVNQVVALTPESGGRFQSRIVSNLKGAIAVEIPVDKNGTQIRWPRGGLVTLFFWKANGQGFSFQSKISGYSTVRGVPCLMVKHSNAVHEAQQRKYRRKPLERPCYFYPVRIMVVGTGKSAEKKAYTETKNHTLGTVLEVSVGGCSIKTTYPLGKGNLIKVEFETGKRAQIAAYGKVVSMTRIKPLGGIMHIMFTRLSQSHMNKINAYIYDLTAERKP